MSGFAAMTKEQKSKLLLYVALDLVFINFSILAAVCLWYGGSIPGLPGGAKMVQIAPNVWHWFKYAVLFVSPITIIVYALFKFYSSLWKYATIDDIYKIIVADTLVFGLLFLAYIVFISKWVDYDMPKRLLVVAWFIDVVLFVFSRSGYRILKRMFISLEGLIGKKAGQKRVLIVGAGYAGYNVVRSIQTAEKGYENRVPVIVVDDDIKKNNTNIKGVRVTHDSANIPRLAQEYEIDEIIVAVPSATNNQTKRIVDLCTQTNCALKMIPPLSNVSGGEFNRLRDVNIADLLSRDEVDLDIESISGYIHGKTILVTGGGGSIGSELARQIARFEPKCLVIFDIYENNAYELKNELNARYPLLDLVIRIGSVRDNLAIKKLFEDYRPDVVFHAAAHKHVPLMEYVPEEAVKNNVFGTLNVAAAADSFSADRFVLLSTDKAVNPTNIMGATKRITELIIQMMAANSKTKFMTVRFGNVLGSNGSVIPLFKKQIAEGGPVRVTDKNITRFFMTIPEACRLVLQAVGIGMSGRIFVLDMGEQIKIDDLARNLIRLSGYVPDKDIKIIYTGLRPGEKLYEELIMAEEKENIKSVYQNKIFVAKPVDMDYNNFRKQLDELRSACDNAPAKVPELIKTIVPNYKNGE